MKKILFASNNIHKIKEITKFFNVIGIEIISQKQYNIPTIEECGLSFIENAILKARHAMKYTELPVLADDSGLCIDALNGDPGIYSARYSKSYNDKNNIKKVLKKMINIPQNKRKAHFQCYLILFRYKNDPIPIITYGKISGIINMKSRGDKNSFGYNPIFLLPFYNKTMAEINYNIQIKINHRSIALEKLKYQLI